MSETIHQTIFRHVYRAIGMMLPEKAVSGALWLATEEAANEVAPRKPDREAELEAEALVLRKNFAAYLAPLYNENGMDIARLCDDTLDRSGALLGYVRESAIKLRTPPLPQGDNKGGER